MSNVSIVIGGFDRYAVLWGILKGSLDKYWPDRPWGIQFITNFLEAPKGCETIQVGHDQGWGSTVKRGLRKVSADIIVWMMEDFWITGPVQTKALLEFAEIMEKNNIDHIRLLPPAYPDRGVVPERECKHPSSLDKRLWVFQDDAEFRASATIGLWKKDVFADYLREEMNPWKFEQEAGVRSRGNDRYLCCIDPYVYPMSWYCNPYPKCRGAIMSRGHWDRSAYEYAEVEGLKIDFSVHPNGGINDRYLSK